MKTFLVRGRFWKDPKEPMRFKKVVRALKPEHAIELVYSLIGSAHRVKRTNIRIEEVVELEQ